jgi:RNA polymerase sigma factor (sigma-70 family)
MSNPFQEKYNDQEDTELICAAKDGSKTALENLVKKHQHYIYNVALKFVLSPYDAEDITQEVLIKMITNLGSFKGESHFRTWLYRITFNHFIRLKKNSLENYITTFENYGAELDNMQDVVLTTIEETELQAHIEDAKIGCMSGMLLCLDREQRLVYILGEIFSVDHTIGSEMLTISKANFRQKLTRARRDLYNFMNQKCGLVNTQNPCRCDRKTKSFIKAGWVDKDKMKFNTSYLNAISDIAPLKLEVLLNVENTDYQMLFKAHPFQEKTHVKKLLEQILNNDKIETIFNQN